MTKKSLPVCCTHQCRMNFLTGVLFQNHTNIPCYTHPTNKVFAQFIGKQYPTNSRKTFFYNKKLFYTIDVKQCIVKYNDTVITFYQCKHELFLVCHIYHATSTEYSGNISMHSHSGYILIICYDKCNVHNFPRYDVTAPYLRMLIGPMDYTPGATMNATRETFRAVNDHPMSQGTRVHQMAMYTLFEAPLQMLADSPSKYMKEQECTDFIAKVPTVFDETVALDGEVGEYLTLARRKGDVWYIASMTDWTPRDCTIDLSFLGEGSYEAEIFSDGINADREATDYKKEVRTVTSGDKLNIHMAPGGGWTARIWKR